MKVWGQPTKGRSKDPSQPSQKEGSTTNGRDTCDPSAYTEDKKDSKKSTEPSPAQSIQQVLGMAIEQALIIWDKRGRPIIHLGLGENCLDLAKLLAQRDIRPEHLSAIRGWLEQHQ